MNENGGKKNRPKSQIMMPNSTSPLPSHSRKNGSSDSLPNHRYENEWEVRSKELAEAKARVAQMEKTMRWWSDCTDNWRRKWSEVKTERNDLRKELRLVKSQVDKLMKQLTPRQQQESIIGIGIGSEDQVRDSKNNGFVIYSNTQAALAMSVPGCSKNPYQKPIHHHQLETNNKMTGQYSPFQPGRRNAQTQTTSLGSSQMSVIDKEIVSLLEEKVAHLTTKLDEVNRRLVVERDDKTHLQLTIERLRRDLSDLQELYESLKKELCDINGKEFTESEVESYAEEETDEARLIEQLAQDGGDDEDLEDDDDFDGENEIEVDKHTPTAEIQIVQNRRTELEQDAQKIIVTTSQDEPFEHLDNVEPGTQVPLPQDPSVSVQTNSSFRQDLASSIQVEISEVHKKLDLKTFISDVAELVGGIGLVESTAIRRRESQENYNAEIGGTDSKICLTSSEVKEAIPNSGSPAKFIEKIHQKRNSDSANSSIYSNYPINIGTQSDHFKLQISPEASVTTN